MRWYPLHHGFSQWWSEDVTENKAARTVELGFFNRATVYRLNSVRMAAPQSAEWLCESGQEWQGTRLIFDTASKSGGTMLQSLMRVGRPKLITSSLATQPGES